MTDAPLHSKRRILFVAWFLNPKRLWLGEHLDPERYECGYVGVAQRVDITTKTTSAKQWLKHLLLALKARWHLLWHRYDLIVSATPQVAFVFGWVNLLTFERTPHVVWYFNCGHEYQGARRYLSRIAYAPIKRFVVYTRHERDVYAKVFALPKERFHFTYLTGAPLDRKKFEGTGAKVGLPARYIASLGSSSRDYGSLFKATEGLNVPIVVVTHRYALEGIEIPPWVTVIESVPQDDYLGILAGADVCVIPVSNIHTASGQMTLIQAMLLEVPLVATRCIGTEDYLVHGETGYFVEMGDVAGLRDIIVSLWEHAEIREASAARALAFAREHFLDASGSHVLDALYDELAAHSELRRTGHAR